MIRKIQEKWIYVDPSKSIKIAGSADLLDPSVRSYPNMVFKQMCRYAFPSLQFFDGWEMNGKVFPSEDDHALPTAARAREMCGG